VNRVNGVNGVNSTSLVLVGTGLPFAVCRLPFAVGLLGEGKSYVGKISGIFFGKRVTYYMLILLDLCFTG